MIRSSFANFTAARLAIQANQSALGVIGQNMGNVKTPGYTRQRLDQISLNQTGPYNVYQANPTAHIGSGVWVTGVSQIRDPFLDTRYRMEMGSLGAADKKLTVLTSLGDTLDETDKDAVRAQLLDLETQLNSLMSETGSNSGDSTVRASAQTLASMFRSYSDSLGQIQTQLSTDTGRDVDGMNKLLDQIQKMNVSIKNAQSHGNPALELQDDRNLLIDELSTYANIKVTNTPSISSSGIAIDCIKIDIIGNSASGIQTMNLINDVNPPGQFTFTKPENVGETYRISLKDSMGSNHQDVTSNKGTLTSSLNLLNDSGEFGTPPSSNRGVGYYQSSLDSMANKLAEVFNNLNTMEVTNPDGTKTIMGGPLFATNDGSGVITAGNLTLSEGWQNGTVKLLRSRDTSPGAPDGDQSNIANMVKALKNPQTFKTPNDTIAFQGNFYDCFSNIINVQGVDQKSAETLYKNSLSITNSLASSKDSISGVSMDEEAMNMLQYNNALSAASRLMTTLDEALNTIINSMGITGR